MAFLDTEYSTETLPKSDGGNFEPLPPGWYSAVVAGAELKQTKSGSGQYIAVRYDITGPTHEGRVVFGNINIRNQNQAAERIGLEQLNSLMLSIGLSRVRDTDQLIGGTCQIKLSIKEDKGGKYGPRNEVKGLKPIGGAAPNKPQAPIQNQQKQPAPHNKLSPAPTIAKNAVPPWAKKTAQNATTTPAQQNVMQDNIEADDIPF